MILDTFVEERLRNGGIVHFAVAVATVADEVDDHIAAKFGAIFSSHARLTRPQRRGLRR